MAEIKLQKRYKYVGDIYEKLIDIGFDIQTAPIFLNDIKDADVVEVVRCKDCKHRNTPDCKMWYQCVICGDYHHWERDEYFCSYGERKE